MDTARIAWQDVLGICGFWDGSFDNGKAVIKMIVKRRRRVQTHRVAFVFVWQDQFGPPKIQIKFADTKNQLADMLTKGSFTRDEWDQFLRLFNIMNFSMFLAAIFFGTQSRVSCRRELKKGGPKKNHLR